MYANASLKTLIHRRDKATTVIATTRNFIKGAPE